MSRLLNNNKSLLCHFAESGNSVQRYCPPTIIKTGLLHALMVGVMLQFAGVTVHADTQNGPPKYQDTSVDFHARAKDLVSRMTLEEKLPQLINDAPAIPRLGVREYNWWNEGLHGVAAAGYATVFPQAIGMASTWDTPLMGQIAGVVSTEFRAKYYANQHRFGGSDWFGGLTVWSPNINIFRDPRWGRGQETYGEDPYLTSRLGVAYVEGLQGDDPRYLKTVATPKHFAVYSGPEAKRHHIDVRPSAKDLEETYFPAFRATVMEAKAQSVMCSYNAVDGVPACASRQLLTDKLRKQWGFNGYVVSDCGAVSDVYQAAKHGYAKSPEAGIKAVFDAGMDLICGDANEADHIRSALKQGLISEAQIDQSLVRLFSTRMRLGQFDPRPQVFPDITAQENDTKAHRQLALTVAEKSLVLLKNRHDFLPLISTVKSLAVVGPNADNLDALVGNYNGSPSQPITLLQGMRARFGKANIHYAPGSGLLDPIQSPVPDNLLCVDVQCHKPGLTAEYFADKDVTAKPLRKSVEANAQLSWQRHVASGAVRWTGYIKAQESGVYSLRYLANGGYRIWVNQQLIVDAWNVDWRSVIASGTVKLVAGKTYPLKVEAFQRGEQGDEKLVWSLPSDPGVKAALQAAEQADAVVFAGGLTTQLEGEEMPVPLPGFSGGDRTNLSLPPVQRQLLDKLYATGKPVVVVLMNGSALAVNQADKKAAAIVEAWYPGQSGGQAVARLLAGDFSPAGRLPVTFYPSVDELPAFDNYAMANRTYRFFTGDVLYPFGYGLSYSQFRYSHMAVSPAQRRGNQPVTVSVDVTNTGKMDADEVVQLYLSRSDVAGSPIRTLVGFKRIHLAKGQTSTVSMRMDAWALSSVDAKGRRVVEPGTVTLWMGGGQPDTRSGLPAAAGQSASFRIEQKQSL
ncbi:glycoside hydrolase family 3 C-terminal domain-containing protein [Gynuella sp.]|uniref:glycoside hydrolase family 3 protein n=1 Tax=Gynuella sp. TaxID=2969146 RepID=UPI003D0B2F18